MSPLEQHARRLVRRLRGPAPQSAAAPYAPRSATPQIAVMTMVRDEGDMLRLWVDHHARLVGLDNLVVLDDQTSDGSTDGLGCTVHRLPELDGRTFEVTRMRLASRLAEALLLVYDYVVFLDADEFLVTSPEFASLGDLLAARDYPEIVGAVGLNVVQVPGEASLDLGKPLLDQRGYAVFAPIMCKPALKRVPAPWAKASHGIRAPYAIDPDLFLLHLKFADRDRLAAMAARRNEAFRADGRAEKSSWSSPAENLVAALDRAVGELDLAEVPTFEPRSAGLDALIFEDEGVFRPPKQGQLRVLKENPVQAIPDRLRGRV